MSRKLTPEHMSRYHSPAVVDHLASNYVLGTLSPLVRKRIDGMRQQPEYRQLHERIHYWQKTLAPLDNKTPEQQPLPETWQNIQEQLGMTGTTIASRKRWFEWVSPSLYRWATALSLVLAVTLGLALMQQTDKPGAVSYVAVLADSNQTPQVVATSYANNRDLRLNILALPNIEANQSFELWVTSKTDGQARSLGAIPVADASFNRTLTKAEWGLIKDSDKLLITVENQGGSATGEPSNTIVSSGLCIRLAPWETG